MGTYWCAWKWWFVTALLVWGCAADGGGGDIRSADMEAGGLQDAPGVEPQDLRRPDGQEGGALESHWQDLTDAGSEELPGADIPDATVEAPDTGTAELAGSDTPDGTVDLADMGLADLSGSDIPDGTVDLADMGLADLPGSDIPGADGGEGDVSGDMDSTQLQAPPGLAGFQQFDFDATTVDPVLADLLQAWLEGGPDGAEQWAGEHGIQLWAGKPQLMVRDAGGGDVSMLSVKQLVDAGGTVLDTYEDVTWMAVPFEGLAALIVGGTADGFENLWVPGSLDVEPVGDESPPVLLTDWAIEETGMLPCHQAGNTGQGVTVAILDSGFQGLPELVESGLLPKGIKVHAPKSGLPASWKDSIHGAAVAQVVHRAAPGAKLELLIVLNTDVSLQSAVDWCIQNGVDVINASWGRYNESFYDGSGPVSAAAKKAWEAGIVWVAASGNSANGKHWHGPWSDGNDNGTLEFADGSETTTFVLPEDSSAALYLTWDAWALAELSRFQICLDFQGYPLANPDDVTVLTECSEAPSFGADPKTGMTLYNSNQRCIDEPDKFLCVKPEFGLSIRVGGLLGQYVKPPAGLKLSLFATASEGGFAFSQSMAEGSLTDPAVAPDVITVGAVHANGWDAGTLAPYSSFGPTSAGVQKPELVAPSGVYTAFKAVTTGTSFSAPYVAGAAALLLQQSPGMSPAEVKQALIDLATPVAESLPDPQTGFGRLHLNCCEMNCANKDCGDDGCGGSCGTCGEGAYCYQGAECVPVWPDCMGKCDDGNSCTEDLCLVNGVCINQLLPEGSACKSPGDWKCENGLCTCVTSCGTKQCGLDGCGGLCGTCDDGIACTVDQCDFLWGTCKHTADPGVCDDSDACTADACDPDQGGCANVPTGWLCNDGVACTTDGCNPATGCFALPKDAACDDQVACSKDHCDAEAGCENLPMHGLCDDLVDCTDDTCVPGVGCLHSPQALVCDDGDPCTEDSCLPDAGCASNPLGEGAPCAEGKVCQGGKCVCPTQCDGKECGPDGCGGLCGVCTGGAVCLKGACVFDCTAPCDDGIACTVDLCTPETGCVSTPDDSLCPGGSVCDKKACDPKNGCITVPPCDDGSLCTNDLCDPEMGGCYHEVVVTCDDGNVCTDNTCDPATGKCKYPFMPWGHPCAPNQECMFGTCVWTSCLAAGNCPLGSTCGALKDCYDTTTQFDEFMLNFWAGESVTGDQTGPTACTIQGDLAVVLWRSQVQAKPGAESLRGRVIAQNGHPFSGDFAVVDGAVAPVVLQDYGCTLLADGFMAAWVAGDKANVAWFGSDGIRQAPTTTLAASGVTQIEAFSWLWGTAAVVLNTDAGLVRVELDWDLNTVDSVNLGLQGNLQAAACDGSSSFYVLVDGDLYRFAGDGTLLAGPVATTALEPDSYVPRMIPLFYDDLVVVFEASKAGSPTGKDVYISRFGLDLGVELLDKPLLAVMDGEQVGPGVAYVGDGGYYVAWTAGEIFGQRFGYSNTSIGPSTQLNSHATGTQGHLEVVPITAGRALVVWESTDMPWGNGVDISGRIVQVAQY
jgi:hypothetical protein